MFRSGGARREPAFFLLLCIVFLVAAGWAIAWRALTPSDGTVVNTGDFAVPGGAVTVETAAPDGPLRAGDQVLSINGATPGSVPGGPAAEAGQVLRYQVLRDGRPLDLDVPLRPYPVADSLLDSWPSILVVGALLATSGAIFAARPRDPATQAAITASAIGAATVAGSGYFQLEALDLVAGSQFWRWYGGEFCFLLLWGGMLHFALSFPEVGSRRRFCRHVLAGYGLGLVLYLAVAGYALLAEDDPLTRLNLLGSPSLGALFAYPPVIAAALIGKYVTHKDPLLRKRMRWLVAALGGGATLYLVVWTIPAAVHGTPWLDWRFQTLAFLPVPFVVSMAIARHQALNIEVVLSRSLVYGTLSVLLAGLYVGVVSVFSLLFPPVDQLWQQAIAAALIALAVQPLRARVQALINTRLFGERHDPYHVVSALASRLEKIHTPAEQLPAVVETIGVALRLPYVAIELDRDAGREKAASYGEPTALCHRLPLSYQGEAVGSLVIARRSPREVLGRKERSVLTEVARHAGTVVYTARLTTDLIRSRDRLVTAREEERRRLLRELHDGVGPTLAAITLGLHASRRAIGESTPTGVMLARLQEALKGANAEIRRLAHGLRPPVLEKRGLLAALEDYIGTVNRAAQDATPGLTIALDAPDRLPDLPPAVDVAAYRIICEALTNVTRHARARRCTVALRANGELSITVTDDGVGLRGRNGAGIGLSSMRERAAELGGEFRAEQNETGGTRVCATLPLPPPKETDS
ncbi:histidine kinase [Amycolatopsis anabasis]|uniref:histidine kinase n=1 Tax=Amycolatopsis anabasis TaxID=1840409 RepID=UPI00131CBA87|nr:histidine kinase [Amycolatopsis anabasis]